MVCLKSISFIIASVQKLINLYPIVWLPYFFESKNKLLIRDFLIYALFAGFNVFIGKFNSSQGVCASNESHAVGLIYDLGIYLSIFV